MDNLFIVYLKNKTSFQFEYKSDVSSIALTDKGYRITFSNGKNYIYGPDKVKYYPLVLRREDVRIYENGQLNNRYNMVDNYGRYLIFRNNNSCSLPIENSADIEICDIKKNTDQEELVINYFKKILKENVKVPFDIDSEEAATSNPHQISADILRKALENIDISESRSALSNYINGINPTICVPKELLIYPFGCNETQKLAVKTALSNSMSIVEGPPGTGKTQTILNIIANLIVQNKTVAIVSNNNAAVTNVRDKLIKYGYGMFVASLGNNDNKALFFENLEEQTVNKDFEVSDDRLKIAKNEIQALDSILTKCFRYRNKLSVLKTDLSDAEIEFSHVKSQQPLQQDIQAIFNKKFHRKLILKTTLELKNLLSSMRVNNKLSIINKLQLVLNMAYLISVASLNIVRNSPSTLTTNFMNYTSQI